MHSLEFFHFRTLGKFTPSLQIACIIILYIASIVLGYHEYIALGTLQGFPFRTSIVFVPIYEELLFRGVILTALVCHTTQHKALIFSSVLFGIWHLKNVFVMTPIDVFWQVIYTMCIFGPITAWITLHFKTLWPNVIIHYINNLVAVYGIGLVTLLLSIIFT